MNYPKYIDVNTHDVQMAIREGMRPMQRLFDLSSDPLPYFWNVLSGGDYCGNKPHSSYSISHIPGRWLNALVSARDTLGIEPEQAGVNTLRYWTYESMDATDMGLPCCIDLRTRKRIKQYDLHNLREIIHACNALIRYDGDPHAAELAQTVIHTVNAFYDFDRARFMHRRFQAERGGARTGFLEPEYTFPMSVGRYIGPLVKLFCTTGSDEALEQALRLKDVCFRYILDEKGTYDPILFGYHTHSTTSMISSLAQLGAATGDRAILDRAAAFLRNGLGLIALDFGWCIEFYDRDTLGGEINNTTDIMETCLMLGKAGYPGFFEQAELILRSHLLPSQLLDTSFIADPEDAESSCHARLAQDVKGAFGFPCPYGLEYEPGSVVSFNWDIVGGAVGGLCEAWKSMVTETAGGVLSVNMLFSYSDHRIQVTDPYIHQGTLTITAKEDCGVIRVRLSDSFVREEIVVDGCERFWFTGEYVYLAGIRQKQKITLQIPMRECLRQYRFRNFRWEAAFKGQQIVGMTSRGKRLCFFREMDERDPSGA